MLLGGDRNCVRRARMVGQEVGDNRVKWRGVEDTDDALSSTCSDVHDAVVCEGR